ncbi:Single-Minded 1 [Manis pentadactyla]|nr:Single-Minded 1 [Manis pentadactyla]
MAQTPHGRCPGRKRVPWQGLRGVMPVQVMVSRPPVVTRERVEQEPTDTATQPHTACVMRIHGSFCGTRRRRTTAREPPPWAPDRLPRPLMAQAAGTLGRHVTLTKRQKNEPGQKTGSESGKRENFRASRCFREKEKKREVGVGKMEMKQSQVVLRDYLCLSVKRQLPKRKCNVDTDGGSMIGQ